MKINGWDPHPFALIFVYTALALPSLLILFTEYIINIKQYLYIEFLEFLFHQQKCGMIYLNNVRI